MIGMLGRHLRFACRLAWRTPLFTLVAVSTLALGIGANAALVDVLDEVLLRPLPLRDAGRLVAVFNVGAGPSRYLSTSYPDFEDYARRATSFEQLAAYVRLPRNMAIGDDTERLVVEGVTPGYFSLLRVRPIGGRDLRQEDGWPGASPVIVLSERLWRARFDRDPAIIGRSIAISGRRFEVVGIAPASYRGINLSWSDVPEAWVPLRASIAAVPQLAQVFDQRAARWLLVVGRLRAGVDIGAGQAELQTIAAGLARSEPTSNRDVTVEVLPASRAKFWPGQRASVSRLMVALGGAASLTVLLACANLASLLLERGFSRRREFAVRLALGASRGRLIGRLLVESAALAVPGWVLAFGVGDRGGAAKVAIVNRTLARRL